MSSPIVSFDGLTYTVSLFRPDATGAMKEEKYIFGEHSLEVCAARESDFPSWERSQLKGPAEDGLIYYLFVQPQDVGRPTFIWLNGKEEAGALRKTINEAEDCYEDYWRQDDTCSFCGHMVSVCGGDHTDEMREIQRAALERY